MDFFRRRKIHNYPYCLMILCKYLLYTIRLSSFKFGSVKWLNHFLDSYRREHRNSNLSCSMVLLTFFMRYSRWCGGFCAYMITIFSCRLLRKRAYLDKPSPIRPSFLIIFRQESHTNLMRVYL